ncbi:MAG: NAD(P)H-hydrate dehydratase [Caulobacterales bacterium]|nr:NAD(P)H-hydrate dehydratase [Caulobacterales bacterium]
MRDDGGIISVAEMRAIDAGAAAAGVPTARLMANAGAAVAEAVMARFPAAPVAVLCGPGNNGGDGWEAACLLRAAGWPVRVFSAVPRETLAGDAAAAALGWDGEVSTLSQTPDDAALYIDALFGAGLTRALDGDAARLAKNLPRERVIAVDVPSGVDGDSGRVIGDAAFQAKLTVTFVRKKPAHVLQPGRWRCGEIIVADIGVPESVVQARQTRLWENDPSHWVVPWPSAESHKHQRGSVIVASGPRARTGAARLAARAALRAGAGLSTVLSPSDALAENAAQLTAVMLKEAACDADYADAARTAQCVVIGPAFGLEDAHRTRLIVAIDAPSRAPLVLDADALTLLAPLTRKLDARDVLTPHVGEFKRLFPGLLETTPSRIEAAREAARRAGCVVLLKGPDTVVAAPDGRAVVNTRGTPFLATAGSGDVLAGVIAGLIGQGMVSFEAAAAGAWIHGRAGELFGPGLISEDLTEILPRVLSELAEQTGAGALSR